MKEFIESACVNHDVDDKDWDPYVSAYLHRSYITYNSSALKKMVLSISSGFIEMPVDAEFPRPSTPDDLPSSPESEPSVNKP